MSAARSNTTYYTMLGVPSTSTISDIKRSYRVLAFRFHPDKNPNNPAAEEEFKQIKDAYEVLSDPAKRARYDRELNTSQASPINSSSTSSSASRDYASQMASNQARLITRLIVMIGMPDYLGGPAADMAEIACILNLLTPFKPHLTNPIWFNDKDAHDLMRHAFDFWALESITLLLEKKPQMSEGDLVNLLRRLTNRSKIEMLFNYADQLNINFNAPCFLSLLIFCVNSGFNYLITAAELLKRNVPCNHIVRDILDLGLVYTPLSISFQRSNDLMSILLLQHGALASDPGNHVIPSLELANLTLIDKVICSKGSYHLLMIYDAPSKMLLDKQDFFKNSKLLDKIEIGPVDKKILKGYQAELNNDLKKAINYYQSALKYLTATDNSKTCCVAIKIARLQTKLNYCNDAKQNYHLALVQPFSSAMPELIKEVAEFCLSAEVRHYYAHQPTHKFLGLFQYSSAPSLDDLLTRILSHPNVKELAETQLQQIKSMLSHAPAENDFRPQQ